MKNLDAKNEKKNELYNAVTTALASGSEEQIKAAMENLQEFNKAELMDIHNEYEKNHDEAVLEARGVKALTSEETTFWNAFIDMARADFQNSVTPAGTGVYTGITPLLPKTEYEQIISELQSEHPLLGAINFVSTAAVTKWTIDSSADQRATWHALNAEINSTELLGGPFTQIDMTACKLTSFILVSQDMLDLGPRWVAAYALGMLKESIALGLEWGIVRGNGADEPIGMITDYHGNKNNSTGYPVKAAKKVTGFTKEVYGELLALMSTKDNGKTRGIDSVILVVNPTDYFTKIMPATTGMTPEMKYVNNIFPFPTRVYQSTAVPVNHAVMGVASDYFFGLASGVNKGGKIEYSDHARFLEDQRAYKIKLLGNGIPKQYNGFQYLDISDLEEVFPTIATTDRPKNAYLASLSVGSLELSPSFDKLKKSYTATTTTGTAKVSAVAKDGDATITIKAGDTTVTNGGNASFADNAVTTLKITVTNGDAEEVYTVAVTRGTAG